MSKVCVIVNPNSAKGKGAKCIGKIERAFEKAGIRAEILVTGKAGDAEAMSLQACLSGFGTVVAAGGDGCVNEVVNGIMKSGRKVSMGIIPTGRGNDFAWVAGIPREIEKAVTLIACGTARLIDTGYLEGGVFKDGHYFLNGTGFGFEPAINFTAASYRHLNGMVSYIMAFFHCLIHIPAPYELELEVDGKKQNLCSQQISVCNGRRMGSAFILAPNAILDDGLLDIVYATRTPSDYGLKSLTDMISYGASPRASISLAMASKAYAFIKRRGYVIPEDVRAVCYEVLRHRIGLTYEAEAENVTSENIISDIINAVEVP